MPYMTKTTKANTSCTNLYSKSNLDNPENFNLSKEKTQYASRKTLTNPIYHL